MSSDDFDVGVDGVRKRPEWAGVVQRPVRAEAVEMGLILDEDFAQVAGVRDEDPVEEFGLAVTPRTWTRRLECSTTAKQYSRARDRVGVEEIADQDPGRLGT